MKTRILYLLLICLVVTACPESGRPYKQTWLLENSLNEKVIVEAFYIPFNYPSQPMEKGSYTIDSGETVILNESSIRPGDSQVFAEEAISKYLKITRADSLILKFENGKQISFKVGGTDSLNPLNDTSLTVAWTTREIGDEEYEMKYRINEAHKNKAQ
jgi:hypothetical protein